MHPAQSVIIFTVLSGAGYGMLAILGLAAFGGGLPNGAIAGFILTGMALALVTAGLISSTFHLGRPERAWRAVSQWRSSWLSREGVLALMTYIPAGLFAFIWAVTGVPTPILGLITAILAVITIYCTGMIYGSLKTVPAWNRQSVPIVYIGLGLASGSIWVLVAGNLVGHDLAFLKPVAFIAILLAWGLKCWDRFQQAGQQAGSTAGSALGLDDATTVRMIEPPHQGENYLMREMGFAIARKHAEKIRKIMWITGLAIPAILLLISMLLDSGLLDFLILLISLAACMIGCLLERWLFFAEARHKVTLYYGATAV